MQVIKKEFDASQTGLNDIFTAKNHLVIKDIRLRCSGGAAGNLVLSSNGVDYQITPGTSTYANIANIMVLKGEVIKLNIYSIGTTAEVVITYDFI